MIHNDIFKKMQLKILILVRSLTFLVSLILLLYLIYNIGWVIYSLFILGNVNIETQVFNFLSSIILIVVGIELAELILVRDYTVLVDVLLFAISRKILIKPEFTPYNIIGYLVIIIFILVRRFLHHSLENRVDKGN